MKAQAKFPADFFILVTLLTLPLWVFGGQPLPVPMKLPVSALGAVMPMLAAVILTYRRGGWSAVGRLFGRVFDFARVRNKIWFLPVVLGWGVKTLPRKNPDLSASGDRGK